MVGGGLVVLTSTGSAAVTRSTRFTHWWERLAQTHTRAHTMDTSSIYANGPESNQLGNSLCALQSPPTAGNRGETRTNYAVEWNWVSMCVCVFVPRHICQIDIYLWRTHAEHSLYVSYRIGHYISSHAKRIYLYTGVYMPAVSSVPFLIKKHSNSYRSNTHTHTLERSPGRQPCTEQRTCFRQTNTLNAQY